jgi:DNA-binding IclR family transcriptional regulator
MSDESNSSILRGVRTLIGLAEMGGSVSFGFLAEALALPASTTHRILAALKQAGYVEQDASSGSYRAGSAFLRAATLFSAASTYPQAVTAALERLVNCSGQSAFYGAYLAESRRFRFVGVRYSEHAVQYVAHPQKTYSLLWGGSGRAVAAFLPETTLKMIYECEKKLDEGLVALPDWEVFNQQMAIIREQGYSTTSGNRFEGAHSVAVPVMGAKGLVLGSLGFSMPSVRRDESKISELAAWLSEEAQQLSDVASCSMSPVDALTGQR